MINYSKKIVSVLNKILPTHYEMALTSNLKTPCISYMELTNVDSLTGSTLGYSRITYRIKVWSNSMKDIEKYSLMIDAAMRKEGFKRISAGELYDSNSTMIQKIMGYECLALEEY